MVFLYTNFLYGDEAYKTSSFTLTLIILMFGTLLIIRALCKFICMIIHDNYKEDSDWDYDDFTSMDVLRIVTVLSAWGWSISMIVYMIGYYPYDTINENNNYDPSELTNAIIIYWSALFTPTCITFHYALYKYMKYHDHN